VLQGLRCRRPSLTSEYIRDSCCLGIGNGSWLRIVPLGDLEAVVTQRSGDRM
jgi:hypothetical protein